MCDNRATWNYSPWNTHFYHQYLQQHARMTQWIQNMHQSLLQPGQNITNHETQICSHHNHYQHQPQRVIQEVSPGYYVPPQGCYLPQVGCYIPPQVHRIPQQGQHVRHQRHSFKHPYNSRPNSRYNPHHRSRSQTSAEYVKDNEVNSQEEEDDGSECELVFNVDAILAFRAEKGESEDEEDAKSEESFEFVDTILDENFEFVGLDDAGQMQKMFGRKSAPDASGDVEYDREARIVLFGDRADGIAGLETSLEIMFDHINDLHQPVVYPHE